MKKITKEYPVPLEFKGFKQMPYMTMSLATTEWNQTGSWRYMRPRFVERMPSCQSFCPTANDIEMWIRLFEKGNIAEAWAKTLIENPFPAIMGRVCFHPCMDGCNRKEMGGAVNINMLERAFADAAKDMPPLEPFFKKSGKRIAIIGSGPAGLAAAYHLTLLGHKAIVFERAAKAGGMLRFGIPSYRLPRDILDHEIERMTQMGVEFHLGKTIRDASEMQEMRQCHDALFLAIGAHKSKTMGIPGEKSTGVLSGLELLRRTAEGKPPHLGRKTLVIGGGNTAVDAARTARRLGSDVTVVYRRTKAEMPAFEEEVKQAEAEGVKFEMLLAPVLVILDHNRAIGVECQRMKLGDPDESGRRRPEPVKGEMHSFDADSIFTAIGEDIEHNIIPSAMPLEEGSLKVHLCGRTQLQNVYAGGDLIAQPRTVVDAIGSGKRSAIAIDCMLRDVKFEEVFGKIRVGDTNSVMMSKYVALRGGMRTKGVITSELNYQDYIVKFSDLNSVYFTESKPNTTPAIDVHERLKGHEFSEIHTAISKEIAASELSRCFHCGRCTLCDNCYIYCPDVSIAKKEDGFDFDYHYCKGCGVCMKECPRAALEMVEESLG